MTPGSSDAVDRFIRGVVLPAGDNSNEWDEVLSTTALLLRSVKAKKVTAKRLSAGHFLFLHSGRVVGSVERGMTSLASYQARHACASDSMLGSYLRASGIPTAAAGEQGLLLRAFVLAENVPAITVRLPFFVVGNGQDTIESLVADLKRRLAPNKYIEIPEAQAIRTFLGERSLTPSNVPGRHQIVTISSVWNAAPHEAFTVDVTGQVDPQLVSLAVDAMWALPGLSHAAVDITATQINSADNAAVLAVDPTPDIAEFRYPVIGEKRRVSAQIIEHMAKSAR